MSHIRNCLKLLRVSCVYSPYSLPDKVIGPLFAEVYFTDLTLSPLHNFKDNRPIEGAFLILLVNFRSFCGGVLPRFNVLNSSHLKTIHQWKGHFSFHSLIFDHHINNKHSRDCRPIGRISRTPDPTPYPPPVHILPLPSHSSTDLISQRPP